MSTSLGSHLLSVQRQQEKLTRYLASLVEQTQKENVDPEIWFESLADQERVSEPGTQLAFIM